MKLRVTFDGHAVSITDADTGAPIHGVRHVRFDYIAGQWPILTLDFIKKIEGTVEMEAVVVDDLTNVDDTYRRVQMQIPRKPQEPS